MLPDLPFQPKELKVRLGATLQRYPTEPDTLSPYAPFAAADHHMEKATTMGLGITRSQLLAAFAAASEEVPAAGATILVYER